MKCMKSVAHSLIGAAQIARNCGRRLPLGTGKEDLAAAHGKGGRRPETGLQGCPLVRRERAYKEGRLHTQEYTTCPKTSIGGALGPCRGNGRILLVNPQVLKIVLRICRR